MGTRETDPAVRALDAEEVDCSCVGRVGRRHAFRRLGKESQPGAGQQILADRCPMEREGLIRRGCGARWCLTWECRKDSFLGRGDEVQGSCLSLVAQPVHPFGYLRDGLGDLLGERRCRRSLGSALEGSGSLLADPGDEARSRLVVGLWSCHGRHVGGYVGDGAGRIGSRTGRSRWGSRRGRWGGCHRFLDHGRHLGRFRGGFRGDFGHHLAGCGSGTGCVGHLPLDRRRCKKHRERRPQKGPESELASR